MINILKNIYLSFISNFYKIRMSYPIYNLFIKKYKYRDIKLTKLQKNKLEELNVKGYTLVHIDEIFGQGYFENKIKPIANTVKEKLNNDLSDRFKRGKDFVARFYDEDQPITFDDEVNILVVNNFFYDIAVEYLGSHPRISNIDYWLNIPKHDDPKSSQKWHRDYEDLKLLKVFFYLGDVELGNGPLSFVESSQQFGKFGGVFTRNFPKGVVVEDEQINTTFSNDLIKTFTLREGTVVLADTSGLHKGGHCLNNDRFLYTFTYTTFAAISPRNYKFSTDKTFYSLEIQKKISLEK